jgi:microcystin-dependent protein
VAGLTPGTYNYATITVDTYGRILIAQNSVTPVQGVNGLFPIQITGAAPAVTVGIAPGTITQPGAVQLRDDCNTPSDTLALTANQGFILQSQVNVLASVLGNQFLAGTLNAATGNVVTATVAGNLAGVTAGNPLPAPAAGNLGADVIVSTPGTYSPPGGGGPYNVVAGDKFISDGINWVFLPVGFRAPYATTTSSGVVELADSAETQALADFTRAVTPGTLGTVIASTTARGLVELATDAETLALAATDKVVTPSNLNALQASPTQRGIVQLANVLGTYSTILAPTAALLDQVNDNMIPKTIIDANGDLIVGQNIDTPAILPKGPNGSVLTVDVTAPLGLDWNVPNAPDSVPVGGILWYTSDNPADLPIGYEICDGASYSALPVISPGVPNPYYDLFTVIGYRYGGAGASFNVPDLQGQFIRGFDATGTIDTGRAFGSNQADAFQQHNHTSPPHTHVISGGNWEVSTAEVVGNDNGLYRGNRGCGYRNPTDRGRFSASSVAVAIDLEPAVAPVPDETRPKNVALLPIIKYTNSP